MMLTTYVLPFSSGRAFAMMAATPAAPPPSVTAFSFSNNRKIATAI